MRTTLNIDDDILLAAQELARREHKTAGQVLSELARKALSSFSEAGASEPVLGFRPFPPRGPVVTDEVVARLLDESDLG